MLFSTKGLVLQLNSTEVRFEVVEIYEKPKLAACSSQVRAYLGVMSSVEFLYTLELEHHFVLNENVQPMLADYLTLVLDCELLFHVDV